MKKVIPFRSVVIFGGAGFVGSNWAHRLLQTTDARVQVFDNLSRGGVRQNVKWLQKSTPDPQRLKITIGDVREAARVEKAVQSATEIYHFAAQVAVTTSVQDPRLDFDVNVAGTFNVLEAARKSGLKPFLLFTSTNKVYGHMASEALVPGLRRYICEPHNKVAESQPLDFYSPYGCSKGAADQYVHDYARIFGLPTVVLRMSCIAGPHQLGNEDQGWMAHFLYSALQNKPISIYGDGRQVRDVLSIEDLMNAFEGVRANADRTAGEVYNVGGGLGNSISLLELIDEIEKLTGKRLVYELRPLRPGDQPVYITDYSKLDKAITWRPTINVQQTLRSIYEWWMSNRKLVRPATPDMPFSPRVVQQVPEVEAAS
ncbi:MAG TPA: GDP-mannose 4,6-dehydratase [Terriglobales bacterium]|nr:GDP-mannose 4,6-dehydratase [Terriglobales bacterium]